jgi:hypothetical protein
MWSSRGQSGRALNELSPSKSFRGRRTYTSFWSFLGLSQQLAGFIPDLAHASEPLYHLLKKEKKWIWSFKLQDAFNAVVKILTCDLVLINFDPSKPTILLTDASRLKGLGLALVHT